MEWLNEPTEWNARTGGLSARSEAGTDFWRKTHDGGTRHNGHYYSDVVSGDFTARVKITGDFRSQYDQAGLMVRIDDRLWLKCGIEFMDGNQYASVVVTREYSDWSIVAVPNPRALWIEVERKTTTSTVRYSLDGVAYETLRQTFLTDKREQQVGMMLASPKGPGFDVHFEDYVLTVPASH